MQTFCLQPFDPMRQQQEQKRMEEERGATRQVYKALLQAEQGEGGDVVGLQMVLARPCCRSDKGGWGPGA